MAIDLTQGPRTVKEIKESARPSRVDRIAAALAEMEQAGTVPALVAETPGAFLWEFYKAWVESGGRDGGKNRNSIRRMRDLWLTGSSEVKSLHPKLTGRVRLGKDDARSLLLLFLRRWKFVGVKEGDWVLTLDGYAPFPCRDCQALCDRLAEAMYPDGSEQAASGLLLPVPGMDTHADELKSGWAKVARLYRESDAIINFSRHRVALGETPAETMRFFWHLFKNFYDTMQGMKKIFIWIIDIGRREAEDDDAWAEFHNFEMLKAQFRAFATFDSIEDLDDGDPEQGEERLAEGQRSAIREAFLRSLRIREQTYREKRWKWLCDHTVVIIQNLRKEEFSHLYREEDHGIGEIRLKDIGVTAENILPKMLPLEWARQRNLRDFYGGSLESIADATVTAFYKEDGWRPDEIPSRRRFGDLRYFAHALPSKHAGAGSADLSSAAYSREMDSPGENYDQGFRIVYWAARHRLHARVDETERHPDWAIAVAYLNNQGFRTLKLADFLAIHQRPFG